MPTPPENSVTSQLWGWMRVDCGPTIGWVRRPMFNDRVLETGTSYTVQPFDFQLLVYRDVPFTIYLPKLSVWMSQPWGLFPIFVKDVGSLAEANNITIEAFAGDGIDGLPSVAIVANTGSLSVRPRFGGLNWTLAP